MPQLYMQKIWTLSAWLERQSSLIVEESWTNRLMR
jgi:hypothetical protein